MDRIDFKHRFEDSLDEIIGLLKIASVYDEKTLSDKMPYGENVHKAFVYMKQKGLENGFRIEEYDGHALSLEFGQGEERIDIPCHLDVVAAEKEDFKIRIEDGKLIGRGTSDMKVPMYLCYLSMKMLKEKYPDCHKRIRLVLGGDEERTMNDLKYYVEKAGYPDFAFTPDGYFPLGIGEKGAIMWELNGTYTGVIRSLNSGTQCNIVSPIASCVVSHPEYADLVCRYIAENGIDGTVREEDDSLKIEVRGIASHASRPHQGHSATVDLLKILLDVYHDPLCKELYDAFEDSYGKGFDSFVSEDPYRSLTVNLGILKIENNKVYGQVDCRYPSGVTADELTKRLSSCLSLDVTLPYNDDPTLCDEDDIYVKTMLKTYREITKDLSEPVVSGGVSYSKVFKHCVSYGPGKIDEPSVAHQKGEFLTLENCIDMFSIYYHTIEKLLLLEV
ncbi:MAG: Sapep family Mn(2+)-dependent dipeptidase [Erysipelotrichaceae bacterium]|nr:Sapep family Mn(2+)-dependent dipeptidase [Erysipelotrichaceae bacterium]